MIIYYIIWSVWLLSEILLNRLIRSGEADKKNTDKGTLVLIWITIAISITLGILIQAWLKSTISTSIWVPRTGLVLIVLGMLLRFIAIRSLGRMFTVDVTIRKDHRIKQDGLYKLVRHPSYSGSLLSFLGFGISLNSWASLGIIFVLVTAAMLLRIRTEEKLLLEQFGAEYENYIKKTWRLIPGIY